MDALKVISLVLACIAVDLAIFRELIRLCDVLGVSDCWSGALAVLFAWWLWEQCQHAADEPLNPNPENER